MTEVSTGIGAGVTRRRYLLHGLEIHVLAENASVLGRVHAVLHHLGLPPAASEIPAALVMRVSTEAGAVRIPPSAREIAEQDGIRAWSSDGSLYLSCPGHVGRLDLSAGVGEWMVPALPARPRKDIIAYGLLLFLRRRGLFALHASGVARDGAGFLFAAPCGSGKSTRTYGLVRQGWEYLGDDAILLRTLGDEVEALSLRRDLCLDPALSHAFPEVTERGEGGPFAGKGKRRLPMRALHPDRLIDRCVPRVLVFPEIVPEPTSRLVPVGAPEAFMRLCKESVVLALDAEAIPSHLQVLGRLAGQARGYRLLAGRDLWDDPEAVSTLLAGIPEPAAPAPLPR